MKQIVIYKSSTGFTKQYAQWIAKAINCEVMDIKQASQEVINQYDSIVYGGWIMGNMIVGLDKIIKWNPKKIAVFAVGSTPNSDNIKTIIKEQNHLGEIPLFYFEGGFRFEQLNFFVKMMLKTIKKSVAKKENKTEQDEYMLQVLGTSFDHSNQETIKPMVEMLQV